MTKFIKIAVAVIFLAAAILFCAYWVNTQPVWVSDDKIEVTVLSTLPEKNKKIIEFVEEHGHELAPSYDESVCTEFVIKVIEHFDNLSSSEKNEVRIITSKNIDSLIQVNDTVIKGVQSTLISTKGIEIKDPEVKPGDFVQFWNIFNNKQYGHCGIVFEVDPHESISIYSSHPLTNGFGKQKFLWPDKIYFVRLK